MSDVLQTERADAEEVGAGETVGEAEAVVETVAEPEIAPVSVGRSLSAARAAAGLSVAEVAQILKFSPRQIEALEADDYDALPGNTIVRGFVRSYGRLLKLDVEVLLGSLNTSSPNAPADVRPPDNMGIATQPGVDRQFSPMLSAAIVLALAALLLALWHFLGPSSARTATTTVSQVPQQTTVPAVDPPPAPAASGSAPTAEPAAAPSSVTTAPATTSAAVATALVTGSSLQFDFQDRSWLEVTDAKKQKLHSGENPAGSRLTVTGAPPFDIVIGNAGKVSLTYGERVIDLAPYTRAEVARLTLD